MFNFGFSQPQQFMDAWTKLAKQQVERMEAMTAELAKLEGQSITRAHDAVDEAAKLMKESMSYASQLSAEWRKLGFEAISKSADAVTGA
jgi:uncharacterized ferritin-like protein (DUF455 family)